MKKITLLLAACFSTMIGFAQGSESFDNAALTGSYEDASFVGDDGFTWTYVHSRDQNIYPIDGNGIMLRRANEPSSLSATIEGGIGNFSVDTRKAFSGNAQRNLELVINGEVVEQFMPAFADGDEDDTVFVFEVNDINVEGQFTLELRLFGDSGNQQIILDNIEWTGFDPCADLMAPEVETTQSITEEQTLEDIEVTGEEGATFMWYSDEELTTPADASAALTEGEYTFYVTQTVGECTSEAAVVNLTVTLSLSDFDTTQLSVYPNPATNNLTISYNEIINQVEVYNVLGQKVINQSSNSANISLNVSQLNNGTYLMILHAGEQKQQVKFLKK